MLMSVHVDPHPFNGEVYLSRKKILTFVYKFLISRHKPVFLWGGGTHETD